MHPPRVLTPRSNSSNMRLADFALSTTTESASFSSAASSIYTQSFIKLYSGRAFNIDVFVGVMGGRGVSEKELPATRAGGSLAKFLTKRQYLDGESKLWDPVGWQDGSALRERCRQTGRGRLR